MLLHPNLVIFAPSEGQVGSKHSRLLRWVNRVSVDVQGGESTGGSPFHPVLQICLSGLFHRDPVITSWDVVKTVRKC